MDSTTLKSRSKPAACSKSAALCSVGPNKLTVITLLIAVAGFANAAFALEAPPPCVQEAAITVSSLT